jgi:alpha-tubulin suppressor-like RCC1 family protein
MRNKFSVAILIALNFSLCLSASAGGDKGAKRYLAKKMWLLNQAYNLDSKVNGTIATTLAELSYSIAAAEEYSSRLSPQGVPYCSGYNYYGQLGDGTEQNRCTPTRVLLPEEVTFESVSLGRLHACGFTSQAALYCWGNNEYGQLGDRTEINRLTPTPVHLPEGIVVVSYALGGNHTCVLTSQGDAYCFGENANGQLGDGTLKDRSIPTRVLLPDGVTLQSIALGENHSCGLTKEGILYCWGSNEYAQLGDGSWKDKSTPTRVSLPDGATFDSIALGISHTCGLTPKGTVLCFGNNEFGQLCDGEDMRLLQTHATPTPIKISEDIIFESIVLGGYHTCGLTTQGDTYCCGKNSEGQLGNGTKKNNSTPTRISLPIDIIFESIALGKFHSCGLTPENAIFYWGNNYNGPFGDGTKQDRLIPTLIEKLSHL